jgi:hypothetical protein
LIGLASICWYGFSSNGDDEEQEDEEEEQEQHTQEQQEIHEIQPSVTPVM